MGAKYFGASVKRREDPRFLRGEGRFVDDLAIPGMLHAAFLRSPHAHAVIKSMRTAAAAAAPGVVRVLTFAAVERWMKPLPLFGAVPPGLAAVVKFEVRQAPQWALCRERARHVGEIVAMVVADSPERAQDASLAPFTESLDVMGDGSLMLLPTPGHTAGSASLLVRRAGRAPLLLAGDLTYGAEILQRGQLPGVGNRRRLAESSRKVLALAGQQPGLVVLPAHDPTAAQRLLDS